MKKRLVLLPGFRKCGTTTIYDFLAETGQFNLANVKEPQVIAAKRGEFQSIEEYTRYFSNQENTSYLDGSTYCMSDPSAIINMLGLFDEVKLIVCVRNPIDRFISAYWHHKGKSPSLENRSIELIVSQIIELGQQGELKGLDNQKKQYYGESYLRKVNAIDVDFRPLDPLFAYKYFSEGLYSNYLEKLIPHINNIKLIFFEDITNKPVAVTEQLEQFLGMRFDILGFDHISNTNKSYDRSKVHPVIQSTGKVLFSLVNQSTRDAIKSFVFRKTSKPNEDVIKILSNLYEEESKLYANRYNEFSS